MKTYGGVDVLFHVFLTSALVGGGQLHSQDALLPGRDPRQHGVYIIYLPKYSASKRQPIYANSFKKFYSEESKTCWDAYPF
jgi:hypothetical protein